MTGFDVPIQYHRAIYSGATQKQMPFDRELIGEVPGLEASETWSNDKEILKLLGIQSP